MQKVEDATISNFSVFWGDIIKKTADSTVYLVGTNRKAKIYNKEKEKAKNQRKMANRRMKRLKKTPLNHQRHLRRILSILKRQKALIYIQQRLKMNRMR